MHPTGSESFMPCLAPHRQVIAWYMLMVSPAQHGSAARNINSPCTQFKDTWTRLSQVTSYGTWSIAFHSKSPNPHVKCYNYYRVDNPGLELYSHHILSIAGQIFSLVSGGIWGSICNLTWFAEASTPFVNGRQVLAWHEQTKTSLYLANGLMMTWSFFVVRVVYYIYMIFYIASWYCFYEPKFWEVYYPESSRRYCGILSLILFTCMFFLQMLWFYKIMMGLLKALGCVKSKKKAPKKVEWKDSVKISLGK